MSEPFWGDVEKLAKTWTTAEVHDTYGLRAQRIGETPPPRVVNDRDSLAHFQIRAKR